MKRELERIEIPDEHEARVRGWEVVRGAFAEREPVRRRRRVAPLAVAFAAALAILAAALSPPGQALIDSVRETIGVERAQPALFDLPADGRLLVTSARGSWIVQPDGSKRLLGRYREASWSPRGLFVVAARANELVALDPKGNLRWSLPRPTVRHPRWASSGFRIAYLSGSTLRVVAGDGTGDRLLARSIRPVAPAWRHGERHVLAYVQRDGRVAVRHADSGATQYRTAPIPGPRGLVWSSRGRLLVVGREGLVLFGAEAQRVWRKPLRGVLAARFAPDGRRIVVLRRADVLVLDVRRPSISRRVFASVGSFQDVEWSPDGRWLLVAWKDADQWLFIRSEGARKVEAVSSISAQFRSQRFPTVAGWCCATAVALEQAAVRVPIKRPSRSLGLPWAGKLVHGVQLPAEGATFFTWDPILRRSPGRGWRRYGSDRLVRVVLSVLADFRAAHPDAPRIGVGDLSRPRGGDFGVRYGYPGHASHQNGLDADVYYPRRDRRERAPASSGQIDRRLAQELVDRFVRAGATRIFVGPRTGLQGPRGIVQILPHHETHLHVRLGPTLLGHSALGRSILLERVGEGDTDRRVLVVGCIHGNECAGLEVTRRLLARPPPRGAEIWVVPDLNPDGLARGQRQNGRGVDLNRNFGAGWRARGRRGDPEYPGLRPWSEPESRIARDLVLRVRPAVTIWFHQPQGLVRAWGASVATARRYARLAGMRFRRLRQPSGAATAWQGRRLPGTSAFVVELPPGPLDARRARRHVEAILRLAE